MNQNEENIIKIEEYFSQNNNHIKKINEIYQVCGSYMEAILEYCEKYDIEIETIAELVKHDMQALSIVSDEAENLNIIPKSDKLF